MHNEITRKITSLTLMTIMVAGGVTFGIPGVMPAAEAANANLFVSAENSMFENYIAGPQVIEVVVDDPGISDTDEAEGTPDVEVNGNDLLMTQASDGRWYGYFASKDHAIAADATVNENHPGTGLDYGSFCSSDTTILGDERVTDTDGIAIPINAETDIDNDCSSVNVNAVVAATVAGGDEDGQVINVIREAKSLNTNNNADGNGQINLASEHLWPFIQLYDFNPTGSIVIDYNKGGGTQSATFTFDTVDGFAGLALDRTIYPRGSQVHATVTDAWLNIDPTDEDSWSWDTIEGDTYYQVFDESGNQPGIVGDTLVINSIDNESLMQEDSRLLLALDSQGEAVMTLQTNNDAPRTSIGNIGQLVTVTEQSSNSGVFGTYDEADTSILAILDNADRGNSATIDYNDDAQTVLVGFDFATIDIQPVNEDWSSGEEIPVILVDGDANKNSRADEDLILSDPNTALIPSLRTGSPFTLGSGDSPTAFWISGEPISEMDFEVQAFSDRAIISSSSLTGGSESSVTGLLIDLDATMGDLRGTIQNSNTTDWSGDFKGYNLFNYNVDSFVDSLDDDDTITITLVEVLDTSGTIGDRIPLAIGSAGLENLSIDDSGADGSDDNLFDDVLINATDNHNIGILYSWTTPTTIAGDYPIVSDFMSFGFTDDGDTGSERVANQIVRFELEEDADNSATFAGTLEYIMVNQLNILDAGTYDGIATDSDGPIFIVMEDFTDEDSPRINYLDLGADGVSTQVADQQPAPSHSGIVTLDSDTYKVADTVTITIEDADLNVDSGLLDIFTVVTTENDTAFDMVGAPDLPEYSFGALGRLLDVTFDDQQWLKSTAGEYTCDAHPDGIDDGLGATGIRMIETGVDTGTFVGDFQIPAEYCARSSNGASWQSVTGTDIEVNYVDFRDASGEIIEVGDSAGVRANTGTISLDRTVYPVPWGDDTTSNDGSVFPLHATATGPAVDEGETLGQGDLTIHVRVADPDFDISASGEDVIATDVGYVDQYVEDNGRFELSNEQVPVGPIKITVSRGGDNVVLAYAGGSSPDDNFLDADGREIQDLGDILETAPDSGVFELDFVISHDGGPEGGECPDTDTGGCVLQGDILTVEYTDPTDASGDPNTITDSATFDLRNGVLQSDKSVYIIGSDMILTIIEPDWDLDSDAAETYDLDILEWDSDAATTTMGDLGVDATAFDPEPSDFRETGDSTGIFQIVVETPLALAGDRLERGEQIDLEYTDWGPSGADYVGQEDEDIRLTVFTSNFGATVDLDQKVYTWTDKVYITVVAPDHNNDSDLIDEIGEDTLDPILISSGNSELDRYKLVETGTDTGIFTGEVILTGFLYDADGSRNTGDVDGFDTNPRTGNSAGVTDNIGPTDGFLEVKDSDEGITVSFEFSEDETVVSTALIRWNIGEVTWLEKSYPASGTGVLRVVDPDMNLNPEAVDNFEVDVNSGSDASGIELTVTETNEATGIFEGTVFFTLTDPSSGHRLRVAEGDTITATYDDRTLPAPHDEGDRLRISASSLIGTLVPALERAPATNLRITNAAHDTVSEASVGTQLNVVADLRSGQDESQPYIYLVQVKNADNTVVELGWIDGTLIPAQSMTSGKSWMPDAPGVYTAEVFVWESLGNPTPLSPSLEISITVN